MKQFFGLLLLSMIACTDRTQTTNVASTNTSTKAKDTISQAAIPPAISNSYGFDTTYEISKEHTPFMVTGFFNPDKTLDTAILIRHKSSGKDALFIKHSGSGKTFLLKNGEDVAFDFDDFNWVAQFKVVKKGTKVWDYVIDGEIVGEDQVPDSKKFFLQNDGIFVHIDEASGGGIIYYKKGKYAWVQQE
jgi:hypothetical protein